MNKLELAKSMLDELNKLISFENIAPTRIINEIKATLQGTGYALRPARSCGYFEIETEEHVKNNEFKYVMFEFKGQECKRRAFHGN